MKMKFEYDVLKFEVKDVATTSGGCLCPTDDPTINWDDLLS